MEKAESKENRAIVDASKVKEEDLKEVVRGKCWKGFWLSALNATGEIFNQFPMKVIFLTINTENTAMNRLLPKLKYISETWILPFAVLFAIVAYTVLAIVFYNIDG